MPTRDDPSTSFVFGEIIAEISAEILVEADTACSNVTGVTTQFGFPRSARMLQAREFELVFRRPNFKKQQQALRIRARENRMHGARLGLVVGKRQVPRAHDRNRLKRICRETFRQHRSNLPEVDIVVQVLANQGNRPLALGLLKMFDEVSIHFNSKSIK